MEEQQQSSKCASACLCSATPLRSRRRGCRCRCCSASIAFAGQVPRATRVRPRLWGVPVGHWNQRWELLRGRSPAKGVWFAVYTCMVTCLRLARVEGGVGVCADSGGTS